MVIRDKMIAHRASVFEENSVIWMARQRINLSEANNLPTGYRAVWSERAKLAVAKLSNKIQSDTSPDSYPGIALQQGATTEDDQFIEVHIWGSMTIRTFEHVTIRQSQRPASRIILKALQEKLNKIGVTTEVKQ
jgi:hypothetical protein